MINIKFKVIIILILLFTSLSLFSSRGSIDGDNLVITEVFYDTIGCDTDCEWVEIYNPTSRTIKLNGWFLADNTGSNPLPNFSVAAGGYFIFARNGTQFNSNYGFLPDDDSMTRSLGNAGDQLSLINDNGTVVDFVAWEGGVSGAYPSWTVSAVDKSIRRKMDTNFKPIDTDSNNDWENSGTTGDPNSGYGGTGDTESPVVTITNPTSTVVAGTLSIGCSATDNSGSTTTYEIKIDGISKSNSSTYSWDTSLYNDGSHIIKCEVNDSSSNLGFEEKVVVVDNSPTSDLIKVYFNDPLAGVPQMANPSAQAGNLSLGLTTLLDSANSTIYASLYHIGWEPVIDSLIAAYNRSVTVKLAVDLESIDDFQSLIDAGISVTGVNASSYIMHNKFYVVDGEYVFTGSWNPTVTGTIFNANDGIQIKSIEVANAYTAEFNQLFAGIKGKSKIDNNDEIMKAGSITVEVYFAPKDTGRDRLIELIDSANTSIHLSLFYFTDNNIFAAIERAKNRSVTIKGVFDLRGWENSGSESDDVIAWGFGIVDALPGVNHHKFGVIDGKIVWTGSTNWSAAGFEDNDENSVVVHSTRVAAAYIQRTEELYDDASSYDASTTAAPRIVTKHYKPSTGSNLITWRPRMNGNMASPTVEKYLVWRWNTTLNTFELLAELNWAYGYYYDSNISYNTTYYYCVSSVAFDGTESGCSAEYAQIKYTATSGSQPTLYPASGHLSNFATETTNPVVSIQNPTNTETVSGFVDITFTADDKSYINTWEVYINGILKTSDSHYQWDSTAIADGSYTIMAKARDTAGNWGQHSITVSVDNSAYLPPMSPSLNTFKFATYNIENSGLNPNYINVLKEENPDVFVLVETGLMEDNGNASLNVLLVELNEYFNNEVPYQFVTTIGQPYGTTGLAIFSRFEILNALLIPIVTLDSGLNFDVSHDFLSAEIAIGNNSIFVIGSHLKALPNSSNELKRELAQEGILNYMDSLGTSTNIIYAGDLNSYSPVDIGSLAPTNPTLGYGPVNMTLNGNHTASPVNHTYTDVYRYLHPSTLGYTYNTTPYEARIDFIIINSNLLGLLSSSSVGDTANASVGSDHYLVDLTLDLSGWSTADTMPPTQVTGISGISTGSTTTYLSWSANSESDLSSYSIYRNGSLIAQTTSTSYNDSGLVASTTYSYKVSATDTSGNEGLNSTELILTTNSTTPSSVTKIILSEVFYDTPGTDSLEEWIEIYNAGTTIVNISYWTLRDNTGTYTIANGTFIAPGEYLIFARSSSGFIALYGFSANFTDLNLSLSNSGDKVSLHDANGTEVDFVAWENFVTGWNINASTGNSIARIDITTDSDSVSDWTTVSSNGSPGG